MLVTHDRAHLGEADAVREMTDGRIDTPARQTAVDRQRTAGDGRIATPTGDGRLATPTGDGRRQAADA